MTSKRKVNAKRCEQLEELAEILQIALPPLLRADWDSFALKATGCDVKFIWDKDCEQIILTGRIRP